MTARDEAEKAAARVIADRQGNFTPPGWWHEKTAREALAAAVPVLLNDLADRIEAQRPGVIGHQFNIGANAALSDAAALVRAAAEGWGATNG